MWAELASRFRQRSWWNGQRRAAYERFFRTLKEQIVHGRIYQNIDDLRAAIGSFVARYNAEWLIEKNGLRSPCEARATWNQALMKVAA